MHTQPTDEALRFPRGRFTYQPELDEANRARYLAALRDFPGQFRETALRLSEARLDTPYRPGGWTGRQVIHHVADSHLNAYTRFKLALTEDTPTIKGYDEKAWAELPDTRHTPIAVSLDLLAALHQRWTVLLEHMAAADWSRAVFHPEQQREITLARFLALYAWHGEHHRGHLEILLTVVG